LAKFMPLVGIIGRNAGRSPAIRVNPVKITFGPWSKVGCTIAPGLVLRAAVEGGPAAAQGAPSWSAQCLSNLANSNSCPRRTAKANGLTREEVDVRFAFLEETDLHRASTAALKAPPPAARRPPPCARSRARLGSGSARSERAPRCLR
jgi:hypothetical protein